MSDIRKLKRSISLKYLLASIVLLYTLYTPFQLRSEAGKLSLTYQNQLFKTIDPYNDHFTSLNSIYLNLWQGLGNGSSFNFSINYYFDRGLSQVASYNLGLQNIPLGKFKVDADFGTISYPLSSLPIFGSFNPSSYRGLKGGKITFTSPKTDIILFGGQLYGDFGYRREKGKLYGARTIFRPHRRWTVGTGWMKVLDMPTGDLFAAGGDSTGDYDVFSLDASVMAMENLYLLGDFRYIYDQSERNKNGFAVKTGTYYNAGKVSFEIFYNYISPNYPHLGTIFIQDHKGVTVMGQYRPVSWLSLFGGIDTLNDQLNDIQGQWPTHFMTYRFGSTLSLKTLPQFSANYSKSIKDFSKEAPPGGAGSPAGGDFDMLFLSLSQHYHRFFWSIYYNKGNFNKPGDGAGNYRSNRVFLNLRWSYPTGHYIYLTGALNRNNWKAAALDNKNMNIQLGATVRMASYFQFNLQGDYAVDSYSAGSDNRRLGFGGGVIYRFKPLQVNCSLRYQYAKSEASLPGSPPRYSHQAFFSITRDFKWGPEATGYRLHGTGQGTGKIKGCVFVDINQNDRQEPGEEGLEGIDIIMDNIRVATTGKNGRFTVASIPAGRHRVSLDLRNIPASYEAAREKTELVIKKKETGVVNLTVIPVGLLSGRVIFDRNENNIADTDEPLLRDIRVNLFKEDKLLRWEFTNARGVFTFDNLRPGSYVIKVDEESVYEKYNGIDKAAIEVTVKPWEEKKGLLILLNEYKKNRVKKVLDY